MKVSSFSSTVLSTKYSACKWVNWKCVFKKSLVMRLSAGSFNLSLTPHGPWVQIHNNHLTSPWKSKATARFANPLLTGWFPITQFPGRNLLSVPTASPAQQIYSLNKGKQLFKIGLLNGFETWKAPTNVLSLIAGVRFITFLIGISHCNFTPILFSECLPVAVISYNPSVNYWVTAWLAIFCEI